MERNQSCRPSPQRGANAGTLRQRTNLTVSRKEDLIKKMSWRDGKGPDHRVLWIMIKSLGFISYCGSKSRKLSTGVIYHSDSKKSTQCAVQRWIIYYRWSRVKARKPLRRLLWWIKLCKRRQKEVDRWKFYLRCKPSRIW